MIPRLNPLKKRRRLHAEYNIDQAPAPLPRREEPAPGLHKPIVGVMGVWK